MANRIREILAKRIERNGGYGGRWDSWALEWTVGIYCGADIEEAIEGLREQGDTRDVPAHIREEWDADAEWGFAQEHMANGLHGDDCAYRTPSHPSAIKWGLPYDAPLAPIAQRFKRRTDECAYYPAKVAGWVKVHPYAVEEFDADFQLQGRGGKHAVLARFEGVDVCTSSDDLAEAIRTDDCGNYSNKWCRKLLAMLDDWDESLTSDAAEAEMRYLLADQLQQQLNEHDDEQKKAAREAAEAAYWAERDVMTTA